MCTRVSGSNDAVVTNTPSSGAGLWPLGAGATRTARSPTPARNSRNAILLPRLCPIIVTFRSSKRPNSARGPRPSSHGRPANRPSRRSPRPPSSLLDRFSVARWRHMVNPRQSIRRNTEPIHEVEGHDGEHRQTPLTNHHAQQKPSPGRCDRNGPDRLVDHQLPNGHKRNGEIRRTDDRDREGRRSNRVLLSERERGEPEQ